MSPAGEVPQLSGAALEAVRHRGSHIQIIAAAGSGKTEVVSQRVVDLLADGLPAEAIVAFTFTERAADELKQRIARRVEERLGRAALDRLTSLFVGTIHAYCFRLLQQHVPRYETYDVLDENQLTAFLSREATRLERQAARPAEPHCSPRSRRSSRASTWSRTSCSTRRRCPSRSGPVLRSLLRDARALSPADLRAADRRGPCASSSAPSSPRRSTATLRHLIVDEYQDVNPAQERLIELLTGSRHGAVRRRRRPAGRLPVARFGRRNIVRVRRALPVGDDVRDHDQPPQPAADHRRRRTASRDRSPIGSRRRWGTYRDRAADGEPEVVVWTAASELEEAGWIASLILDLARRRRSATRTSRVLVRGRAAYPRLSSSSPPSTSRCSPEAAPGLFDQPEAVLLGQTFTWLTDIEWRDRYGPGRRSASTSCFAEYQRVFELDPTPQRNLVGRFLRAWKAAVPREDRVADLVGELYELLAELDVRSWDLIERPGGEPARHARAVLRAAGRLRVGAPPRAAGPRRPRRAGRRPGPRHVVLPQPRTAHHQLRAGRLRGLRRRGRLRARRGRPDDRAPGQGPRVAGGVRPVGDGRPIPEPAHRRGAGLARAARPVPRGALRGQRRRRAAAVLRRR